MYPPSRALPEKTSALAARSHLAGTVDLMLPNLDGLEVIESLSHSHPGLPLLCITGLAPPRRLSLSPP
jgi:hypothetical protein